MLLITSVVAAQTDLQKIEDCRYIATDWSDGDSFRVATPDGTQFTVRLYGADCLELHVANTTDARRLRAQRRYFGISQYGRSSETSIHAAKKNAAQATEFVKAKLSSQSFKVVTAFADGRGGEKYKRYYAFVLFNENGRDTDLAEELVRRGLARAFGVDRSTIDGRSRDEYENTLKDLELQAISQRAGAWALTDWNSLPTERRLARADEHELKLAQDSSDGLAPGEKINLNVASRDSLMRLPGIGEAIANLIIEGRPFKSINSLEKVHGIGPKTMARIRGSLEIK